MAAAAVALGFLSSVAWAGEFYSWIDASGTMVFTDDASRIPPETVRSPVAVYRFQDSRPSPSQPRDSVRGLSPPAASVPAQSPADVQKISQPPPKPESAPVNPAELDLPQVLLDAPDETTRTQYFWVPLLAPVYVGSSSVSGFWCHRNVQSPVEAFKQFLRQHLRQTPPNQPMAGGVQAPYGVPWRTPQAPSNPIYNSGNYVYDQVMRERQALTERIASQFRPPSPAPRAGSGSSGSNR